MQKGERRLQFIVPMECLEVRNIAEGPEWQYEVKLDGYRAIVIMQGNEARVYSRNGAGLTHLGILNAALLDLPAKSCILDGELVVVDDEGRPSFNLLQNR